MRVHYDKRGRVRGYSGGPGTYYWFQVLQLVGILLFVIPALLVLLACGMVCLLGLGFANLLGKPGAAEAWRGSLHSVGRGLTAVGRWSDRNFGS